MGEFNERIESSTKATNDKIQALSDKIVEMEKKIARINSVMRDEVTALNAELSVNIQKDKSSMAEIIQAQMSEVTILKGMYKHQMEQLERLKKTVENFGKAQDEDIQKVREENSTIYGTCDSLVTMLHNMAKDIKEIKGKQEECIFLDRKIRVQQKVDAHYFPKILDAAKIGGRWVNQFGHIGGSSSSATTQGERAHGEGVKPTFKTFSNPSGNVFSTFSALKQASQPVALVMTEQEQKDRMSRLFEDHFCVLNDPIFNQDGRYPKECARWYLRNVFPVNDLIEAAECYKLGRVFLKFYHLEDKNDFGKLRKRINDMLSI